MYYPTFEAFKSTFEIYNKEPKAEFLVLVGKDSREDVKKFLNFANQSEIKVFGGVFPKLIANGQTYAKGFIVQKIIPVYSELVHPFLMKRPSLDPEKKYTGILIVDGFSDKREDLIETVQTRVRADINFIGGSPGKYTGNWGTYALEQDAVVFNNKGFYKDVLYL